MRRFAIAFAAIATFLIGLWTLPWESLVVIAAVSGLGALAFALVTTRAAQERLGIGRPPAMKYRKLYDDLNVLYDAIGVCVNQRGPCKPRSEWQPNVVAWDKRFWAFIDDAFYARGPSIRTDSYKVQPLWSSSHDWGSGTPGAC
jgi:hypothetical protein